MVKKMIRRESVDSEIPHSCGFRCLGPLTFHQEAIGDLVTLSRGGRLAQRAAGSFSNGLVFTSRPVKVRERVRLRVERWVGDWHGAMRVGFTTVPPHGRALPSLAIPGLTEIPGHWAVPVPEALCLPGSQLEFWVSYGGTVYVRTDNGRQCKLLQGVDLSQPLWPLIDLYGQTCAVLLLGSERRETFGSRKSCPVSDHQLLSDYNNVNHMPNASPPPNNNHQNNLQNHWHPRPCNKARGPSEEYVEMCVACMSQEASVKLLCGHQCLCFQCTTRVIQEIGTCPLCRHTI